MRNNSEKVIPPAHCIQKPPASARERRAVLQAAFLLAAVIVSAIILRFGYLLFMRAAYPMKYADLVTHYADMYGFEPSMVFALIHTESGFDKDAVSPANAVGLMQIRRDTFKWAQSHTMEKEALSDDKLFEPEVNIRYGIVILSILREEFGDTSTMLAAYNAGIGNVRKWLRNPEYSDDGVTLKYIDFKETRNYVKKIPKTKKIYEKLYNIE